MATGATIRVGGVDTDWDDLFEPRGSSPARPSMGIPFLGADLSDRYRASNGYDEWSADLGPVISGQDIRHYFRKKGWVPPAPVITSCYNDGPQYEGTLIILSVTYTGLEVSRFVWRDPSSTVLQDSENPNYYLFSTSYTQTGTYSVEVFNAGGSDTGTTYVEVTEMVDPPTISVSSDSPRYLTQVVHLTATASNYDSLMWIDYAGSEIEGETGLTYSFTAETIEQSGTYKCRATNSGGHTDGSTYVSIDFPPTPSVSLTGPSSVAAGSFNAETWNFSASSIIVLKEVRFQVTGHGSGSWLSVSGTSYSDSTVWSDPFAYPSIANTPGTYLFYFEAKDLVDQVGRAELWVTVT